MALEIRANRIAVGPGTGELVGVMREVFTTPVVHAHVAIGGYEVRYVEDDHNIGRLLVSLGVGQGGPGPDGYELPVVAQVQLRDENGDDTFSGFVDYVLFAETGTVRPRPVGPGPPPILERA